MANSWTIYCRTHVETGRRYVGLTAQTMEKLAENARLRAALASARDTLAAVLR